MLLKLRAHDWSRSLANFHEPSLREKAVQVAGLDRKDLEKGGFVTEHQIVVAQLKKLADLAKLYKQQIVSDRAVSDDKFEIKSKYIGKVDAKDTLKETTEEIMGDQIASCLTLMVNTVAF